MAHIDKKSARQRILNLPVGATIQFPILRMRPIQTEVNRIQKVYKHKYETRTTDALIKVTCLSRADELKN